MHNRVTSHLGSSPPCTRHPIHACAPVCCVVVDFSSTVSVLYFVPPLSFQPFQMFTSVFNEKFRSNPLCDFRLGTVATSDHETPLTPQVHLLDNIVDVLVCCATTGAHGFTSAENRSGSAVAVHRQFRRHPCRCCATTGYHGPVCTETRDPTGAFRGNFVGPLLCDDRCPWSSVRDPWRFNRCISWQVC